MLVRRFLKSRKSKVGKFYFEVFVKEQIVRLQVEVADPVSVQVLQSLSNLLESLLGLIHF